MTVTFFSPVLPTDPESVVIPCCVGFVEDNSEVQVTLDDALGRRTISAAKVEPHKHMLTFTVQPIALMQVSGDPIPARLPAYWAIRIDA